MPGETERLVRLLKDADQPMKAGQLRRAGSELLPPQLAAELERLGKDGKAFRWGDDRWWGRSPQEALPERIQAILRDTGKTIPEIRKSLPPAFRVDIGPLRRIVTDMVKRHQAWLLHSLHALNTGKPGVRVFGFDAAERLKADLMNLATPGPVTVGAGIRAAAALGPNQAQVRAAFDRLVKAGRLHKWRSDTYGATDPEQHARAKIDALPFERPMGTRELNEVIGMPAVIVRGALNYMVREGGIKKIKVGSKQLFGPPRAIARWCLDVAKEKYGVDEEIFQQLLSSEAALSGPEPSRDDTQATLSDAVWSDAEDVLAAALQDLPLLALKVQALQPLVSKDASRALSQVELASHALGQKLSLAAQKRGLRVVAERGETHPFDGALFDCFDDISEGEQIVVRKQPVVKQYGDRELVVARGLAEAR